jgi:hypothetical protein
LRTTSLARWRKSRSPSKEDQALVAEVLRVIAKEEKLRWPSVRDPFDRTVAMIEPRKRLTLRFRMYTGEGEDEVDLLAVLDQSVTQPGDVEPPDG